MVGCGCAVHPSGYWSSHQSRYNGRNRPQNRDTAASNTTNTRPRMPDSFHFLIVAARNLGLKRNNQKPKKYPRNSSKSDKVLSCAYLLEGLMIARELERVANIVRFNLRRYWTQAPLTCTVTNDAFRINRLQSFQLLINPPGKARSFDHEAIFGALRTSGNQFSVVLFIA